MKKVRIKRMVEPMKPQLGSAPQEIINKEMIIYLDHSALLSEYLEKVPKNHHKDIKIEYECSQDSCYSYISWNEYVRNNNYEKELIKWERNKKKWEEKMIKWEVEHKIWEENEKEWLDVYFGTNLNYLK